MTVTTSPNGMQQTTATLTFEPVILRSTESYVCQILGNNPTALNVQVNVDESEDAAIVYYSFLSLLP